MTESGSFHLISRRRRDRVQCAVNPRGGSRPVRSNRRARWSRAGQWNRGGRRRCPGAGRSGTGTWACTAPVPIDSAMKAHQRDAKADVGCGMWDGVPFGRPRSFPATDARPSVRAPRYHAAASAELGLLACFFQRCTNAERITLNSYSPYIGRAISEEAERIRAWRDERAEHERPNDREATEAIEHRRRSRSRASRAAG